MELIIFIIFIAIAISNSKKGKENSERKTSSVWDQVQSNVKLDDITRGVRDLEDVVNKFKSSTIRKEKQKEESEYQREQQARRKKEEDARRMRDREAIQKKKRELLKKQEERRKKELEKEKKARAEKELLERCDVKSSSDSKKTSQKSVSGMSVSSMNVAAGAVAEKESDMNKDPFDLKKRVSDAKVEKTLFRTEEYLDPLTSSFYPDVDDYLFPTIAPFYPDVDVSSFSLQNPADVI